MGKEGMGWEVVRVVLEPVKLPKIHLPDKSGRRGEGGEGDINLLSAESASGHAIH
jgi:hypothetical protein